MELLAEGRTAQVFAYGNGRVLKLDRPAWNGLAAHESTLLTLLAGAGLPLARPRGTVVVDGRSGVVLDRVDGPSLLQVLGEARPEEVDALAGRFVELQLLCNETTVAGLPPLVPRLAQEIEAGVPEAGLRRELLTLLGQLDDEGSGVCHYDLHPLNVLIGPEGWVAIDWITVAAGPAAADLARTLVLWARRGTGPVERFLRAVRPQGLVRRGLTEEQLDAWVRVVAAARVAEGFVGAERAWLLRLASGSERLLV